jgi:hypothetical protein
MPLRDFDKEGYAHGQSGWVRVNALVRQAIEDDLHNFQRSTGKMPQKWLRKITIGDDETTESKVKRIGSLMTLLTVQGSRCRIVRDVSRAIMRGYRIKPKDFQNEFWALQHWIQNNIRYTFDTGEQFQTPQRVLIDWYRGYDGADCDCLTMLYLAMVRSLGHLKMAIGLVDSRGDGVLSHAISLVKLPRPETPWGDKYIPVELTKPKLFGWITEKATRVVAIPIGSKR